MPAIERLPALQYPSGSSHIQKSNVQGEAARQMMIELPWDFGAPHYLWLLLLGPILIWISQKGLAGLSWIRRIAAIGIRIFVFLALVFALAQISLKIPTKGVSVLYLVDQSQSLTPSQRESSFKLAQQLQRKFQNAGRGDTSGVIAFGRKAQMVTPLQTEAILATEQDIAIDGQATNLEDALKLARASFSPGRRRVVLFSDGNETAGDAQRMLQTLTDEGIAIDVAVVPQQIPADVLITHMDIPASTRQHVRFDVNICLELRSSDPLSVDQRTSGTLQLMRRLGNEATLIAQDTVEVQPGKNYYRFQHLEEMPGFFTYEARFMPHDSAFDAFTSNNRSSAFVNVNGKMRVLWVSGRSTELATPQVLEILHRNAIEVVQRSSMSPFVDLAELQSYDVVVLDNVSRVAQEDSTEIQFPDETIRQLLRHVEHFGAGLVMIGGADSFGLGGWSNTEIEKAMPVDFQIRNDRVEAVGGLALVVDKSGSMNGEKLSMAKAAAIAAAGMLGDNDFIGVYAFDSEMQVTVPFQRLGTHRTLVRSQLSRLASGGGTNLDPALRQAYADLEGSVASVKHAIVLTDGLTGGRDFDQLAGLMRAKGITTSTVAIGSDARHEILRSMAAQGGGNYHQPKSATAVPKIFMKEARKVLRRQIFEDPAGIPVSVFESHEVTQGIVSGLPSVKGMVLTTKKDNPLVETLVEASNLSAPNNVVVAAWAYGLGRTAVWTTDSGDRWSSEWVQSSDLEKLLIPLLRWSCRPISPTENLQIAYELDDGLLKVTANTLDNQGRFLNHLDLQGSAISYATGRPDALAFQQVGPGRYVAEQKLEHMGEYLLAVSSGPRSAIWRSGFSFQDSAEFRSPRSNRVLLQQLVSRKSDTKHSDAAETIANGQLIDLDPDSSQWSAESWQDVYRNTEQQTTLFRDVWPACLVITAVLFLVDIFQRRIAFGRLWRHGKSGGVPAAARGQSVRLDQLKSAKDRSVESNTKNHSFAWEAESTGAIGREGQKSGKEEMEESTGRLTKPLPLEKPDESGYATRLLEAKRRSQRQARMGLERPENQDSES